MKHYSPAGRRNHGRPLKRLLDAWDRNGSTSGPTPWQIYDDDDDSLIMWSWLPRRKYTTFRTRRKFEIKNVQSVPPPVSRHLLTRQTVFSKTLFSIARSTFQMCSVMAIFKSTVVWGLFVL
jgi:hypothetical protein